MLARLTARAASYGSSATTVELDAIEFLKTCDRNFDIVSHVSVLHHVPDYLGWLQESVRVLSPGGCLLTFQDPLRYDRIPRVHRVLDRAAYFGWRMTRGNYSRGLKTRFRRLRGIYSPNEEADFDEYHVVRNGVDSDAIVAQLAPQFEDVRRTEYWSTQSKLWQVVGEKLRVRTTFGILALGFNRVL
jgi:ubiquinone/menaquinone biosynthesis C-methylase UbiE